MTALKNPAKKLLLAVAMLGVAMFTLSTSADAASPWWGLNTSARPATIPVGGQGTIVIRASNLGNALTSSPSTVSATMPAGVSVQSVSFFVFPFFKGVQNVGKTAGVCEKTVSTASCSTAKLEELGTIPHGLNPYEYLELRVTVRDESVAEGARFDAEVSGGGAVPLTHGSVLPIGESAVAFGAEQYSLVPEEEGGSVDTRAGSHPYQLTTVFNLNQGPEVPSVNGSQVSAPEMPRNLAFKLPPGQIGNATFLPQCNELDFSHLAEATTNFCPQNTVIGVATITIDEPDNIGLATYPVPLFNLTPAYGEPVRFGFEVAGVPVILDTSVRSGDGQDYGVTVSTSDTTELVNFISSTVTFWGTPGDPSHDSSRGWACVVGGSWIRGGGRELPCEPQKQEKPPAFLTLPTDCAAPFATSVEGESWTDPNLHPVAATFPPLDYSLQDSFGSPLALDGCNRVSFAPTISAQPSTESASSPTGLDFNVNFEDEGLTSGTGLAQSELKDTIVILPEGFTINPSAGVGLGGCTPSDYARETLNSPLGTGCPNNSKLGTVEIETPLLTQKIRGSVYIAQPYDNSFPEPANGHPGGTLVALYIVAKNPETGILIKIAGKVVPNPVTGQLTTIFENTPQLPFNRFNFHFREGQHAPLISPPLCGTYTTQAQLAPWSAPLDVFTASSSFTITKGYDGGACPTGSVPPFDPGIVSGTINNNGGAFSPFYLHLTRTDGEQEISGFSTNLPSGLTGDLSGIPFCPEANIEAARQKTGAQEEAEPSCPAASQVGHTLVSTGVGAVLAYVPGKIYLAGPFHGAPFSIVSVTSATVGPFDLGTVVLRFGLTIDPYTAQVSVTPTSSGPIPTILKGIVTHVRDIRVYIDRNKFTLNPTSCNPLKIGSTLTSDLGASKTVTSPFQASNCQALGFKPIFKVSTAGKTSRAKGASLTVKLSYPTGAQANIAKVKVDLPKQLPSRLTTLQKACTSAQFNANPAGCPAASKVGYAKAITPLIPEPLQGPAYFVSHGGEAFPNLIIVLQGYGVTIDLVGDTFINEKTNVTSSTFKTVPDQPVGSFELTLPQGPNSALAATSNLCKSKLTMPTKFTAQNGAVVKQTTRIAVTGCPKLKKVKHRAKKASRRHRTKRK
jgi:hypothetical protein